MRAVGITEFGGPEVLRLVDLPDPEPGPGEVRVRVRAAAVNPTDTVLRSGGRAERLRDIAPPHVPGMDAAGELEQIGQGVHTDLRVGDRVMAIVVPLGQRGAYAERVVVPAESVVREPGRRDGCRGSHAAHERPHGATGSRRAGAGARTHPGRDRRRRRPGWVRRAAGQGRGPRASIADAAPADEALVHALGADLVVPRGHGFADSVRGLAPEGADGLVDGALLDELAVPAVADGGRIVTVRGYEGPGAPTRGITFFPVFVRSYAREQAKLDRLREQAEDGTVTLRVARTLPAAEAAEAHRLLEAGGVRGRLVLEF